MTAVEDFPLTFGSRPGLFGVLTAPATAPRTRGVLICAPTGHPNVCSHRPLRTLARGLAAEGWPTLRFDWPGTGDSGDPDARTASWPETWLAAIDLAVAELRANAGVEEVALLGLRFGGTLAALYANRRSEVGDLALLAPYVTGRTYLRETRAFEVLSQEDAPAVTRSPLPEGAIEASGFLLSPREVAGIRAIDLVDDDDAVPARRRVLILNAPGTGSTTDLTDDLTARGAVVETRIAADLQRAWEGTGTSVLTRPVISAVARWLSDGESGSRDGSRATDRPAPPRELKTDTWSERPFTVTSSGRKLVGVVSQPADADLDGRWLVFLNAGRVRRIGPNRLVTRFARSWAADGLPSLRLDLGGIGDSDGAAKDDEVWSPYDVEWYLQESFQLDIGRALAELRTRYGAERFVLAGLCSGANWGFRAALDEPDVAGVALLNPRVLFPDRRAEPLEAWSSVRKSGLRPSFWRDARNAGRRDLVRDAARGAALVARGKGNLAWQHDEIVEALTRLRGSGARLSIVFSGGDAGLRYFERHLGGDYLRVLADLGVTTTVIDGADHTFRPLWSHELLQRALERHLADAGFLRARARAAEADLQSSS